MPRRTFAPRTCEQHFCAPFRARSRLRRFSAAMNQCNHTPFGAALQEFFLHNLWKSLWKALWKTFATFVPVENLCKSCGKPCVFLWKSLWKNLWKTCRQNCRTSKCLYPTDILTGGVQTNCLGVQTNCRQYIIYNKIYIKVYIKEINQSRTDCFKREVSLRKFFQIAVDLGLLALYNLNT